MFIGNSLIRQLAVSISAIVLNATSLSAFADSKSADRAYNSGNYQSALSQYQLLAEQQHAKAYYQLGVMHYKGLGTKQNELEALIWFSLAAQSNYDNARALVSKLLGQASDEEKDKVSLCIMGVAFAALSKSN